MGKKKNNGIMIYGKSGPQYFDPEAVLNLFQNKWQPFVPEAKWQLTLKEVLERTILDGPDVPGA